VQAGAAVGIKSVQLFVDGALKTTVAGLNSQNLDSYSIPLALPSGQHSIQAKAITSWNVTGASPAITVGSAADTTAPKITINPPTAPSGALPLSMTVSGTMDDSTATITASMDGSAVVVTGTTSWSAGVTASTEGNHSIIITAKDAAGNAATKTITWSIAEEPKKYTSTATVS